MNCVTFLAILAACICLSASFRLKFPEEALADDRIINGETAKPGQFPYYAGLYDHYKFNASSTAIQRCGGSIISNRWILSAAHCMHNKNNGRLIVVVGTHKRDYKTGQVYVVVRIVQHPSYTYFPSRNDIAALSTKTAIQFCKLVKPIPLNKAFIGAGVLATVTGHGLNSSYPQQESSYLQFLHMHTMTNEDCRIRSYFNHSVYDGTICTWAEKSSACHGDSGGPLAANGKLIGVVSWGNRCDVGLPNGFERISLHWEWIQQVAGVAAV